MKRPAIVLAVSAGIVLGSASGASAGEVTGTGDSTPIRDGVAGSICAFSGLDDDDVEDDAFFGRVQSYGQLVRQGLKDFVPGPGVACNPTAGGGH